MIILQKYHTLIITFSILLQNLLDNNWQKCMRFKYQLKSNKQVQSLKATKYRLIILMAIDIKWDMPTLFKNTKKGKIIPEMYTVREWMSSWERKIAFGIVHTVSIGVI